MSAPAQFDSLPRRCRATNRQGKQCGRFPIPGGAVCRLHGGAAPQVQKRAKERLAGLVDPAIDRLQKLMDSANEAVALGAVKDVLDRNGHKAPTKVDQSPEGGIVISWQDSE